MRACARNAQYAGFVSYIKRVEDHPRLEKLAHVILHGLEGYRSLIGVNDLSHIM